MPGKRLLIVPIFIPFAGCRHQCVYCDQTGITGSTEEPSCDEIRSTIEAHLLTWKKRGPVEAAFYGGSFTALPAQRQIGLLECVSPYLKDGKIGALRVSTRPDAVSKEALELLLRYGVKTVELGVQSMSDEVLRLSGRGHSASDTVYAAGLLKEMDLKAGLQFMPGLPGDTEETVLMTAKEIIRLCPDFVRVYPSVVLKGTPLEEMYKSGKYAPWEMWRMVRLCREISRLFKEAGIPVARMGLHHTKELEKNIIAGPYHPSFRQLVEGTGQIRACNINI